jgi:putative transcriptional regulator
MPKLKYKPVPHDHNAFRAKASERKGFGKAYEALALDHQLAVLCTVIRRQTAMTTKRNYKREPFEAIHASVNALHRVGAISKTTLREFDETCLTAAEEIAPQQIKKIRESNHVSQTIFARYLNTSESTVQKRETGAKRPSGMALRLLQVVKKHGLTVLS